MKFSIKFEQGNEGLNSNRLILNAVIDSIEDKTFASIVISRENHLEDIQALLHEALVYDLRTAIVGDALNVYVKE